ncbi:MAG TPA: hypothetical protein VH062_17630 [Polyangiaceae bacterium]|nr:hypothetical protein [Polyangiaceae bacterium]
MAGFSATGCLFYDSRWGQAKSEQKHEAAHLQPASLAVSKESVPSERRNASVRACVTRAYAAETLGWEARFDELLRNASSVLGPAIGLTLRNGGTTLWAPEHGEGGLSTVIADLAGCEGPETDWVVALVQSTPKVVADFHVLGRGQAYSPYLAIRAPNDPAELEALTRALPDLDEATRQKLYSDRKRHKTLTLFLHELGHTLGAVHRTAKDTIMSPSYDASERGFDDATLALLRDGVAIRLDRANRFADTRKYLETNAVGFVESDRIEQVDLLKQWERIAPRWSRNAAAPPASAAPAITDVPLPVTPVAFDTMSKQDRQVFEDARKLESTSPREAWDVAAPLFEAHPAVRDVQELRCRLAKERKFFSAVIEAHCARLAALGADPS